MEAEGKESKKSMDIEVGGRLFRLYKSTIKKADQDSLFRGLFDMEVSSTPVFDRESSLFDDLLFILRTGKHRNESRMPSLTRWFDALVVEANFYGFLDALKSAFTAPPFNIMTTQTSLLLPLSHSPEAISTHLDGSVAVFHGGKVTSYDWAHRLCGTISTRPLQVVHTMIHVSPSIVAMTSETGVHVYNLYDEEYEPLILTFNENSPRLPTSLVSGSGNVFCGLGLRDQPKTISVSDAHTFRHIRSIGPILNPDFNYLERFPKLEWIDSQKLLLASFPTLSNGSGLDRSQGVIKIYDIRVPLKEVYTFTQQVTGNGDGDLFGDVVWSEGWQKLFKISDRFDCLYMGDLRKMGAWQLSYPRSENEKMPSYSIKRLLAHGKQVVCYSKYSPNVDWYCKLGKNGVEKKRISYGYDVAGMAFGGESHYVIGSANNCIEVWESYYVK